MSDAKYKPIMVVGTGSHVGKSVVAAAICRALARRGCSVAPFKAQNMALNSGITPDGGEMGRAQITQAECAGVEPHVDMNPILLKPSSNVGSQVIVSGKSIGNFKAAEYYKLKPKLTRKVMDAFRRLQSLHDVIVMEGAGSCAEVNLKKNDLVNMAMAKRAGANVALVADIDAGGVFGQVIGTMSLLPPSEKKLIRGVIINKFRGDPTLFTSGVEFIEKRARRPILGVLPHFDHISLPQEDGVALERGEMRASGGAVRIGVLRISHISNYTDADVLAAEPGVGLSWVEKPHDLAGLDLLIIPGTKNTLAALEGMRRAGLVEAVRAYHAIGGKVLGICGGYQLLGRIISDPHGVEGPPGNQEGVGLLPVTTEMAAEKTTTRAQAVAGKTLPWAVDGRVLGYEIHMGLTTALETDNPAFHLVSRLDQSVDEPDGQVSPDGRAVGTYLHGILDNDSLRSSLIAWAAGDGGQAMSLDYARFKDQQYDLLADHLEKYVDLRPLLESI